MSEALIQEARRIGLLVEGYAVAINDPMLRKWAQDLLKVSLPEESPEQPTQPSEETIEDKLNTLRSKEPRRQWEPEPNFEHPMMGDNVHEGAEGTPAPLPVTPMADLSGGNGFDAEAAKAATLAYASAVAHSIPETE